MLGITVGFMDHPSQELDQERHYYSTEQWFSNLSVHQSPLEALLTPGLLGPTPRVSDSLGLGPQN